MLALTSASICWLGSSNTHLLWRLRLSQALPIKEKSYRVHLNPLPLAKRIHQLRQLRCHLALQAKPQNRVGAQNI